MAERHEFAAGSFVMGLLALAVGGGYLIADATDAGFDLGGVDGAVVGGSVLLAISLVWLAKVLSQLGHQDDPPEDPPVTETL